jgi:hypothetical protein
MRLLSDNQKGEPLWMLPVELFTLESADKR